MPNLTLELKGPRLYIKRDDCTGLAFGGNKVRKLEFIMADALNQGATIIITSGGAQTNFGRLAVAAATKLRLKSALILTDDEPQSYRGNLMLDYFLGADLYFVNSVPGESATEKRWRGEQMAVELKAKYEKQGHKCYVIPRGGRCPQGTAGYYYATLELYQQIIEQGLKIDYLVTATGSTSTISSLVLGAKAFNTGIRIIGISVSRSADECKDRVLEELEKDCAFFNLNHLAFSKQELTIFDDNIGAGYAIPTMDGIQAIKLLAQTEAIFADYVYTGKALAGFFDLIRQGYFKPDDGVIFLHTGGGPGLFALEDKYFRTLGSSASAK
jgi:D-cysteine desulfhydrase family pyridoxal phosphate-dependent enzyme